MTHEEKIAEIQERLSKSPGPWDLKTNRHPGTTGQLWGWIDGPRKHWCWTNKEPGSRDDAAFIAHAPEDMRWLLETIEQLKTERDDYKARAEAMEQEIYRRRRAALFAKEANT